MALSRRRSRVSRSARVPATAGTATMKRRLDHAERALIWSVLWCLATGETIGGSGTVTTLLGIHYLNFCVSIQFSATSAQITNIQRALTRGNVIFSDATDGQYRFGD